jgi:hypothetical protein
MFHAVRSIFYKPNSGISVHEDGINILDPDLISKKISSFFGDKFSANADKIEPFIDQPSSLIQPISESEVIVAMKRLNNGRASGSDNLPGELLKYGVDLLAKIFADILNEALQSHSQIDVGKGILIVLQKPGKPIGELSSLRPIVLLFSLIVLARTSLQVHNYLSIEQSGFRPGRSTADLVSAHRWLCAKTQKYKLNIHILGLDLSAAFDTIRRDKLLEIITPIFDSDSVRMIRFLMSETTLTLRLNKFLGKEFHTTIGSPQGDGLSPVLFIVYLEAALRDLWSSPLLLQDQIKMLVYLVV